MRARLVRRPRETKRVGEQTQPDSFVEALSVRGATNDTAHWQLVAAAVVSHVQRGNNLFVDAMVWFGFFFSLSLVFHDIVD